MANETTYALISSLLPDIWEAALMYARESFFMPTLVNVFNDQSGFVPRKFTAYSGGTVATGLGETDNLDDQRQAFARAALATLTPAEAGTQYFLTDRRMDSDDVDNIMADLSEHFGYSMWKQVEKDLVGLFSSFTGGTVGTGGSSLTWTNIYAGRARLAAAAVPPPYYVVLHEYQYYDLAVAANIAGIASAGPLRIRDEIQSRYYVGSVSDMDIYTTGTEVITAAGTVYGGIFSRQAIGFDVRRAVRLEPQRDASLRGAEFNGTMVYAKGLVRPTYGVTIQSDATAP